MLECNQVSKRYQSVTGAVTALRDGTVKEITVKKGDSVKGGQLLAVVE